MGGRLIKAIEWLLLEFEARMITFMIWLCWILGITSDEVEHFREQHKAKLGPSLTTNIPPVSPEPRKPSSPRRHPDHG